MNYQQLTVHKFNSKEENLTISIGPIEELTVTYNELAQMICDVTNAHLSNDPKDNWLGRTIANQTNLFDKYEFALAIIRTSTACVVHDEVQMVWSRKLTPSI